jgi:hypothetical protein
MLGACPYGVLYTNAGTIHGMYGHDGLGVEIENHLK